MKREGWGGGGAYVDQGGIVSKLRREGTVPDAGRGEGGEKSRAMSMWSRKGGDRPIASRPRAKGERCGDELANSRKDDMKTFFRRTIKKLSWLRLNGQLSWR